MCALIRTQNLTLTKGSFSTEEVEHELKCSHMIHALTVAENITHAVETRGHESWCESGVESIN